jgi:tRNA (guanine-N7-)-methyltransferase
LEELFGRKAPVELEIGFGNGEFLHRRSLETPERDFLGIEIAWPSVKRALRRLGNPPRSNARLICQPARSVLERSIPPGSLARVSALFPVPWPKNEKKRLFSRDFLDLLSSRLGDGGLFILVTDHLPLAEWILEESRGTALPLSLENKSQAPDTKYQRKWLESGAALFHHLKGEKRPDPAASAAPEVFVRPLYVENLDPSSFSPRGVTGETTVVFKEFVFDPLLNEGLLNAKVVEDSFVQEFFIRVRKTKDNGPWKLYPAHSERVFPTQGVQLALTLAAEGGKTGP